MLLVASFQPDNTSLQSVWLQVGSASDINTYTCITGQQWMLYQNSQVALIPQCVHTKVQRDAPAG